VRSLFLSLPRLKNLYLSKETVYKQGLKRLPTLLAFVPNEPHLPCTACGVFCIGHLLCIEHSFGASIRL
jgi:hypothetical protein